MEADRLKTSEFFIQSLCGVVIGSLGIQTGFVFAWPSFNVANFQSNETVLGTPMSLLQISLLGSLPNVGGLLSMPVWGWAYGTLGRKYGTMLAGLPYVISWLIISLTSNITLILIAAAIAGAGVAGQNVSNIFVSEIAHVSIRGGLTSMTAIGFVSGLLISYVMGGQLQYMTVIMVNLITSGLTILVISLLPESPVFLVLVGKEEQAAKSIAFYRRLDIKSKQVEAEIAKIRQTINPKLEKVLQEDDQAIIDPETVDTLIEKQEEKDQTEKTSQWKFLMKSKSSKRILIRTLIIIAVTILTGGIVLQVYAEPLFAEAVPSMSANQCSIFVGIDTLIASLVCMFMVDKYGRKSILISTTLVSGVCTGLLGLQLQLHWAPHWFTVVLIFVYGFMYTTGCAMVPYVLLSEVFLPEVRSLCNTFCYSFVWIFNFLALIVFNPIVESVGLGPVFYIFCFMCFACCAYMHFYLPETKGMPVDTIQVLFLKQNGFRKSK